MGINLSEELRKIFRRPHEEKVQQYINATRENASKVIKQKYDVKQVAEAAAREASRITRSLVDKKAEELTRIRQTDFDPETKRKMEEIGSKKNQAGFIDKGALTYEDVVTVLHGVGKLMNSDTTHLETNVQRLGEGPVASEHLDSFVLQEFQIGGLKVEVGHGFRRDETSKYMEPAGYGFGLWISGNNGPLQEQLIFEVGNKLDSLGVPLIGSTGDFVNQAKGNK